MALLIRWRNQAAGDAGHFDEVAAPSYQPLSKLAAELSRQLGRRRVDVAAVEWRRGGQQLLGFTVFW
jgi:hypothetical protein